jgi:restriction system protein
MLLAWIQARIDGTNQNPVPSTNASPASTVQGTLWATETFREDSPTIRTRAEYLGAIEHLEYAVFRRYQNQLTRAERAKLDNTIENTTFKIDRYLTRRDDGDRQGEDGEFRILKETIREHKERAERLRLQAQRADHKLAQLSALNPEGFEEFVGELFEALGYEVEQVGGSGDEGADLRVTRGDLRGVVQCKYHKQGVIGSPQLQKFLGTVHHTRSHKGFYVTTSTFSLAAEKFVADHPIELIDGTRLVELVRQAIGPGARKAPEPAWFR